MNGPQHYAEAERLVEMSRGVSIDDGHAPWLVACAQVHATLALAAAQAWPVVDRYKGDSYLTNEWSDAIGWIIPAEIVDEVQD